MAVFRCKTCGGNLEVEEGASFCVCEYCGTRQTLPAVRDEKLTKANITALLKRGFSALENEQWKEADGYFEQVLNQNAACGDAYWGKFLASRKYPNGNVLAQALTAACDSAEPGLLEACPEDSAHIETMVLQYTIPAFYEAQKIRTAYAFDRSYAAFMPGITEQRETLLKGIIGDHFFKRAQKFSSLQADEFLETLEGLMDARIQREKQKDSAEAARIRKNYDTFLQQTDQLVQSTFQEISEGLETRYQKASQIMKNASKITEYRTAGDMFRHLNGYKKSAQFAKECYAFANVKELTGDRVFQIGCLTLSFILIFIFNFPSIKHAWNNRYSPAKLLAMSTPTEEGKSPIAIMAQIPPTATQVSAEVAIPTATEQTDKDGIPENVLAQNLPTEETEPEPMGWGRGGPTMDQTPYPTPTLPPITADLQDAQPGSYVFLGHYEQDGNSENGPEAILWRVLAREENQLLLLSEYGLAAKSYHGEYKEINWEEYDGANWEEEYEEITWEDSSLRKWLNGKFYEKAFSAEEQEQIATTEVKAEDNLDYEIEAGNDTQDKIFLLSIREAETYFKNDEERQCRLTTCIKDDVVSYEGKGEWWLRSPGRNRRNAARVSTEGAIWSFGNLACDPNSAVRPAFWLNLRTEY